MNNDNPNSNNEGATIKWYYQHNNQQTGPIVPDEIEDLIRDKKLIRTTKVWREGMADWQPAVQTELKGMFPKDKPPPIAPPPMSTQITNVDDVKRLNTWFMVFWICLAAGIPLSPIVIGIGGIIASVVFYCFILHKLWSLIPAQEAKTTPGKAVGFLFIPFFNLYWNFIAFNGLAQQMNVQIKKNSIVNREVNEGLTLTYCILACCSIIPYLGILTGIVALVIWIITLKQLKDSGIALIEKNMA